LAYFLGVDAGGTKTEFLLGDEDRELGRIQSGSIKRLRRDEAATEQNLNQALDQLAAQTGISMQSVATCCVGASGSTAPLVSEWIASAFRPRVGGELLLVEDVDIALDAAFPGGRGLLILAGTGSNIAGRGEDGQIVTAGGWGPALSDEGSGYFLGLEALRRGFRAIDEGRTSMLLETIQSYWGLASFGELVEYANANPAPEFSALAPLVIACAMQGDEVAGEVVRHSGAELAALAAIVIERIRSAEEGLGLEFAMLPVALAGSILEKVPRARRALEEALDQRYPGVDILAASVDPVQGALWRARQGR
jgi:N-acetylglucosamine kinase-like BadF-type ATPase